VRKYRFALTLGWLLALESAAWAGMAGPLPENPQRIFRLNETPLARLQAISFFLFGLLLSATAVWGLWNYLQRDFPKLPRLSFGKALAGVVLWGLLFVIVLAMISGARELMTLGAWSKQGFTYRLSDGAAPADKDSPAELRRRALEKLRMDLWHFAATHQGRFPSQSELSMVSPESWEVPETGGLHFLYVAGQSADQSSSPLAYEPELESDRRIVLQTNGQIVTVKSEVLQLRLAQGEKP
jgi:hypothetical protein